MIIVLGTPGAGKTTQTQLLGEYLNRPWFSMGELIRQKVTGKEREEMLAGKIIDDEVTLRIVDEALKPLDTVNQECVFEGNPRSIRQAQWWLDQIKSGRFNIKGVLHLVVSHKIAHQRMENRGRIDDTDEQVIQKRFEEYHRSITPTLEYLKEHGVKVYEIDASGTIEEVADEIHKTLGV
jgi:adenylate kinase